MLVLTWISFENNNLGAIQELSNIYQGCAKKYHQRKVTFL